MKDDKWTNIECKILTDISFRQPGNTDEFELSTRPGYPRGTSVCGHVLTVKLSSFVQVVAYASCGMKKKVKETEIKIKNWEKWYARTRNKARLYRYLAWERVFLTFLLLHRKSSVFLALSLHLLSRSAVNSVDGLPFCTIPPKIKSAMFLLIYRIRACLEQNNEFQVEMSVRQPK